MQWHKNNIKIIFLLLISTGFICLFIELPSSFGFFLGDADPMVNNMWLEPANPKPGDMVSINLSVYNLGTDSTKSVTDVVTVGYFINGDLISLDELPDILPGIDNGVRLTSGPIWEVTDGTHTITSVLNYHDTLSHLTDNLDNNIMQKTYHLGDWQNPPSRISYDLFQEFSPNMKRHIVTINGNVVLPEYFPEYRTPRVNIEFTSEQNLVQKYTAVVDRDTGNFYWRSTLPIFDNSIPITVYFYDERSSQFNYSHTAELHPVTLQNNESLIALKFNDSYFNLSNQNFIIVIYDESYQVVDQINTNQLSNHIIKKFNTSQPSLSSFVEDGYLEKQTSTFRIDPSQNILYVVLPGDKIYNFEVYSENQLEYTSFKFLENNKIITDVIDKPKTTYPVNLNNDESLLAVNMSGLLNSHEFNTSDFEFVFFQDSYEHLYRITSFTEHDDLNFLYDDEFLSILPANHNYIVEIYLEGEFLTAFETFLTNKTVVTQTISSAEIDSLLSKSDFVNGGIN